MDDEILKENIESVKNELAPASCICYSDRRNILKFIWKIINWFEFYMIAHTWNNNLNSVERKVQINV